MTLRELLQRVQEAVQEAFQDFEQLARIFWNWLLDRPIVNLIVFVLILLATKVFFDFFERLTERAAKRKRGGPDT